MLASRLVLAVSAFLLALLSVHFALFSAPRMAELRQGTRELSPSGPANAQDTDRLATLAAAEPLDTGPYIALAISAAGTEQAGRLADAIQLRNPRSRSAWLIRLDIAQSRQDMPGLLTALTRLYILDPARRSIYLDLITQIAAEPGHAGAFLPALSQQPPWGREVADRLLETQADTRHLAAILTHFPSRQSRLLNRLIAGGAWDEAYITFLSFVPPEMRTGLTTPVDGEFRGLGLPTPFTWTANRSQTRLEPEGGLAVRFSGRSNTWLAWQILALSPGSYTLATELSGSSTLDGGYLRWEIRCAKGPGLQRLDIQDLSSATRRHSIEVTIPQADCPYQRLSLSGIGGTFPAPLQAVISRVTLTRDPSAARLP
ncbi:hypothetical protein BBF93_13135 [Hyphomonas sp. CACIAM 19H1]|uniref:hypothetical protein n=1 Tax=Hyphomonas sp. CACIAM 19H1 TaxID=1873716 RepID=UPI000DEDE4D5|nr:hypothetical protein [Hyphomonas sp. CACIAM 19H1]AXE65058.1 hypothetical protein BBF93_13135 [Hyphomonas sp. CACIAM 19H1]